MAKNTGENSRKGASRHVPASCNGAPSTTNQQPIEVVSVLGSIPPFNPGGPVVELTLKNVSGVPIVSLTASLGITRAGPPDTLFTFNFDVTSSNPLLPDKTIVTKLTVIGGGLSDNVSYPLIIEGNVESGTEFSYTKEVQIESPGVQNIDPWLRGVGLCGLDQPNNDPGK